MRKCKPSSVISWPVGGLWPTVSPLYMHGGLLSGSPCSLSFSHPFILPCLSFILCCVMPVAFLTATPHPAHLSVSHHWPIQPFLYYPSLTCIKHISNLVLHDLQLGTI